MLFVILLLLDDSIATDCQNCLALGFGHFSAQLSQYSNNNLCGLTSCSEKLSTVFIHLVFASLFAKLSTVLLIAKLGVDSSGGGWWPLRVYTVRA